MILDLMGQTVTVEERTSVTRQGVPTYAAAVSTKARVELKDISVIAEGGRQILADGLVYVPTSVTVSLHARLVYNSVSYQVLQVKEFVDFTSPRYKRLTIQRLSQ